MELKQETMPELPEDFPKPLWRGVIIKRARLAIEDKILLPQSSKTPTNEGYIMAIAPELKGLIKIGQRVLFNSKANLYVIYKDVEYLGVHENDVYACIETDEHGIEQLKPFNETVLVRKGQGDLKIGSILLPDNQKLICFGTVFAVGEKVMESIKPGQKVVYNMYVDFSYMFRGKEVMSMTQTDILILMPHDAFAGTADLGHERRADLSPEQMPEIEPKEVVKGTLFHPTKKD